MAVNAVAVKFHIIWNVSVRTLETGTNVRADAGLRVSEVRMIPRRLFLRKLCWGWYGSVWMWALDFSDLRVSIERASGIYDVADMDWARPLLRMSEEQWLWTGQMLYACAVTVAIMQ
jgi:hypothetical protein